MRRQGLPDFEEFAEEAWQKTASLLPASLLRKQGVYGRGRTPPAYAGGSLSKKNPRAGPLPSAFPGRRGTAAAIIAAHPRAEVIDLDAGCCGLAGSFGYEKEHYEISRLVGEQRLFPALRKMESGTVVVAPGFSCRMQISHFTGIRAVHPVQLLNELFVQRNA